MIENEDDDPVGEAPPPRDPRAAFTYLAERHGLIERGQVLDAKLMAFATDVVELCAAIGDGYGDGEAGGNAGEHIRAEYYD